MSFLSKLVDKNKVALALDQGLLRGDGAFGLIELAGSGIKIDDSGQLGIGITPTGILQVDTSTENDGIFLSRSGIKQVELFVNSTYGGQLGIKDESGAYVVNLNSFGADDAINTGNQLAIGAASSSSKLRVETAVENDGIFLTRGGTNQVQLFVNSTYGGQVGIKNAAGTQVVALNSFGDNRDFVNTGNNFGVGTPTPAVKFEISDTAAEIFRISKTGANADAPGDGVGMSFNLLNDGTPQTTTYAQIVSAITDATSTAETGDLYFYTRFEGSLSPQMKIIGNGNVGIGGSPITPTAALHVEGTGTGSGSFALKVDNQGSALPILYARDDGNVGIGTITPETALEVVSDAAQSLTIYRSGAKTADDTAHLGFYLDDDGDGKSFYAAVCGVIDSPAAGFESGGLTFLLSESGTPATRMALTTTGLFIGTGGSPTAKLHVRGQDSGSPATEDVTFLVQNSGGFDRLKLDGGGSLIHTPEDVVTGAAGPVIIPNSTTLNVTSGSHTFPIAASAILTTISGSAAMPTSNYCALKLQTNIDTTGAVDRAIGASLQTITLAGTSVAITQAFGARGEIEHKSEGTLGEGAGLFGQMQVEAGAGLITTSSAIKAHSDIGGGSITDLHGVFVTTSITGSPSPSVTTAYGVKVGSVFGATTNIGVYIENAGDYSLFVDSGLSRFDDQVVVGATVPASDAKMEVASTSQGFMPPRMTTAQRDLLGVGSPPVPTTGMIIYNTDAPGGGKHQGYSGGIWNDFY